MLVLIKGYYIFLHRSERGRKRGGEDGHFRVKMTWDVDALKEIVYLNENNGGFQLWWLS